MRPIVFSTLTLVSFAVSFASTSPHFASANTLPTANSADLIATADLNGDGHMDIVAISRANSIDVFLWKGDGTLALQASYSVPDVTTASSAAIGDFNSDGHPDLVVATDVNG